MLLEEQKLHLAQAAVWASGQPKEQHHATFALQASTC
jgi:hypothetical protein